MHACVHFLLGLKIIPEIFMYVFSLQYLPQLTSSSIFPALDNKKYYNNLRKFNYHLPNIWTRAEWNHRHHQRAVFSEDSGDKAQSGHTSVFLNKRVQPLFKVYVSSLGVCRVALDTDVSLCTIPPTCGLYACWFYVCCLCFKLFLLYFVDVWRQGAMCCSARSRWVDWR